MTDTCPKCQEPLVDRPRVGGFNNSGRYERYRCGTLTGGGGYRQESPACLRRQLAQRDARIKELTMAPVSDREFLGQLVRCVWVEWAREQPDPKPHWLSPWEDLSEPMREVDRRIGAKVAEVAAALLNKRIEDLDEMLAQRDKAIERLEADHVGYAARIRELGDALDRIYDLASTEDERDVRQIAKKAIQGEGPNPHTVWEVERERLQAELAEWLDMVMRSEGFESGKGDPNTGWWDTMTRRDLCAIGDRLVELGKWERHPDGSGTRQWYRPLTPSTPTTEKPDG